MAWWREKKSKKKRCLQRGALLLEELIDCCDGKSNPIKFFSADEIRKATDNFSQSNYVGELRDLVCKWYSGKNENHQTLLIKKAKVESNRERNFCRDIAISSMVSGHTNFLKLIGCCLEFKDPVMVYHGVKKHYQLDLWEQPWKKRMKIAEDITTALGFLHTAFPRPFVYTSLSLQNIFLDEDGVAKLSDFSFCVSIPKGQKFVQVDSVVGVYNYMELNYMMNGVVSEKTDIFAIGMFMQTLLVGQRSNHHILAKEESDNEGDDDDSYDNLLSKFIGKRRIDEIADSAMSDISEEELCQMKAFLMIVHRCIGHRGEVPTMVEVAKELKKIQRSLQNKDSSSPSAESIFDSAHDISSSVLLSNQSKHTKVLLTNIACQVFDEMFQWVILRWFRFFKKNRK